MGIFEFLKNKQNKSNEMGVVDNPKPEIEPREEFVADLSYVELQGADWVKFAGILKKEGVLSNSYIKQPSSVEISLDKNSCPEVMLEFKSKTSTSIRKVQLMKDRAYLYVNGAIEAFPETQRNKDLNRIWKDFQHSIRYRNMNKTNRAGYAHSRRGARLMTEAQKMLEMRDIYAREQAFLEQYKDAKFDEFCYSDLFEKDERGFMSYAGELPKFIPLKETEDGHCISGDPVIPFTPRTLEHCILHMTNGQRIEDGQYPADFEKKCREIQKYSCFESEDWDKVINFGKKIVRNQFLAHFYRFTREECIEKEQ